MKDHYSRESPPSHVFVWTRSPRALRFVVAVASIMMLGLLSCTDLTGAPELPDGTVDPKTYQTPDGAIAMARAVVNQSADAFARASMAGGALTDEINDGERISSRDIPSITSRERDGTDEYVMLQGLRNASAYAIASLRKWAPSASLAVRGELYALQGYAELYLADLYCSGIPLSSLDFEGDFTYQKGSTTQEVYLNALALFDSAIVLSVDSARIAELSRIGKGRTLLALGRYVEASATVGDIQTTFLYSVPPVLWLANIGFGIEFRMWNSQTGDIEGENGFPFLTGGDPRIMIDTIIGRNGTYVLPHKYASTVPAPFHIASGIEARLIQAEADLRAGDSRWLTTLNTLRTDGSFSVVPNPSGGQDTVWHAGSGGVEGLRPLRDPEIDSGRVTLLFDERAAWLFITGHRQGDLRRLVREYGLDQSKVYPIGPYGFAGLMYGSDVNLPVPDREYLNPLYTGCYDRRA